MSINIGEQVTIEFDTVCDEGRQESGEAVEVFDGGVRVGTADTRPDFELDVDSGDVTMICVPHFPDERLDFGENGRLL